LRKSRPTAGHGTAETAGGPALAARGGFTFEFTWVLWEINPVGKKAARSDGSKGKIRM